MKQIAYILAAGTIFTAQLMACSDSGTGNSGEVLAGAGGSDAGSGGSTAGSNSTGGSNNTAGKAQGGQAQGGGDPFGGGGAAQGGKAQGGNEPGGQAQGGNEPGGAGGAAGECQPCLQTSCAAEFDACGKSQDCVDLNNCLVDCKGDAACQQKCMTDHAAGKTVFDTLNKCASGKCAAECGGGGGKCGAALQNPTCNTCMESNCCAEGQACSANADCIGFNNCLAQSKCASSADPCFATCQGQFPKGVDDFAAFNQCLGNSCKADCGGLTARHKPATRPARRPPPPGFFLLNTRGERPVRRVH